MTEYNDPVDMPDDERMAPIEFKAVREWLAVSADWLAKHLDVHIRTVRAWESGRYPIPDGVRQSMEELEERTGAIIDDIVAGLMDAPDPVVVTYRDDEALRKAWPEVEFPATWHRHMIMRVALEVPGLVIAEGD